MWPRFARFFCAFALKPGSSTVRLLVKVVKGSLKSEKKMMNSVSLRNAASIVRTVRKRTF